MITISHPRTISLIEAKSTGINPINFYAICLLMILCLQGACAQKETNYAIHANIIFRFTKYIDWPNTKKSGDFIIGIVGDTPLYDELKGFVTSKMVGDQNIVIQKFSPSSPVFNCQILFVSEDARRTLRKIAARTALTSILLVSESEGSAKEGSCINFVIVDEHLKLEINKSNIERRNLNIASELLRLGIIVK